ncbi:MAG: PAS domain-containing protein [Acidobacteria bacterium]|nr:PAS domain-containing protein [Acidobacteriota bacterium]
MFTDGQGRMKTGRKPEIGMLRFLPRTVIGQLVLCTVVLQVIVLAVFLGMEIRTQIKAQKQRDIARMEMQAKLLGDLASNAVAENDRGELARLSEAMRSSIAVTTARITDLDGNTLAVNRIGQGQLNDAEKQALREAVRTGQFHTIPAQDGRSPVAMAPVIVGGRTAAVVTIVPDTKIGVHNLSEVVWNALAYAICALVANVFLAMLLGRTVARPLSLLGKATQQVIRDPESTSGFPLPITTRNEAGQLTHSFNVMVRELQQQRHGLNETLAMLDSMLENAPVGFAFFDRRHRYVRANQFLERMYGRSMEQHFGQTMQEIFPGNLADELEQIVEHVFVTGEDVHDRELTGFLGDHGDARTWICNFYPVKPSGLHVRWVGMVMTEVTSRVRAEEAMRRSEKLAAAGRLAASIAHEINNPLESVTNLLYLIRHHPSLDEEAQEFASLAQRELLRVSEITQQTLRFYRSSTRPEMVRLADIVNSVLTLHAARIQSANIRVQTVMDTSAELFGFAGELRQVLANLVGNAADAMPHGGTLHVRVARRCAARGESISVLIADTGTGIPAEILRRIFEPFYTTKETTGTGLGLWVSEEIVTKHGGRMKVRSRQAGPKNGPSGTVFRIVIPVEGIKLTKRA